MSHTSLRSTVFGFIAVAVTVSGGCQQAPVLTPARSLDRPTDVALVCVYDDPLSVTSPSGGNLVTLPLSMCNPDCAKQFRIDPADGTLTGLPFQLPPWCTGPSYDARQGQQGLQVTDRIPRLYALLPNSSRGELGFVGLGKQSPTDPSDGGASIIDLDPNKPGYGFLPVGRLPVALRVTDDGCFAVTANSGSCDFARVNVIGLLDDANGSTNAPVSIVQPWLNGAPLGARPSWIEFVPSENPATFTPPAPMGTSLTVAGNTCQPTFDVMAAFPGCGLIARLQFADDGTNHAVVVQAAQRTASGWTVLSDAALADLECEDECSSQGVVTAVADGGVTDAGAKPPAVDMARSSGPDMGLGALVPARPSPASFAYDNTPGLGRLFISDTANDDITVLGVDDSGKMTGVVASVTLANQPGGVDRVRLSPRIDALRLSTNACSTNSGCSAGEQCLALGSGGSLVCAEALAPHFLYAMAHDLSVRVLDADKLVECEENPAPGYIEANVPVTGTTSKITSQQIVTDYNQDIAPRPANANPPSVPGVPVGTHTIAASIRCLPVGTTPRTPLVFTPGIVLPGGALPRDVSFARYVAPPALITGTSPIAAPGILVGDFLWIIDSAGHTTAANLADQCPQPNNPALPGGNPSFTCDPLRFANSVDDNLNDINNGDETNLTPSLRPVPVAFDVMPNRLRNLNPRFVFPAVSGDVSGPPRLLDVPQTSIATNLTNVITTPGISLCNVTDQSTTSSGGDVLSDTIKGSCCAPLEPSIANQNFIRFASPDTEADESWNIAWEGQLPGSVRTTGTLVPDAVPAGFPTPAKATLMDSGASYCAFDVHPNDILFMTGCQADTDCAANQLCYLNDPTSPNTPIGQIRGFCLLRDPNPSNNTNPDSTIYDINNPNVSICAEFIGHVMRYRITDVVQTVPSQQGHLAIEEIERCAMETDPRKAGQLVPHTFACLPTAEQVAKCFPQQFPYEVRAGRSFVVSGTVSGFFTSQGVDPNTGECTPSNDPSTRLLNGRIPFAAPDCQAELQADWLLQSTTGNPSCRLRESLAPNRCNPIAVGDMGTSPGMDMTVGSSLDAMSQDDMAPESSLDMGDMGLNAMAAASAGVLFHYDNPVVTFVLNLPTNIASPCTTSSEPDTGICDETLVTFTTLGGFRPMTSVLGSDITAQLPRAMVTGPDLRSLYVVDEGRQSAATGTRGQLIRYRSDVQQNDPNFKVH